MNYREKFVTQVVICLMIFSAVKTMGVIDSETVRDFRTWADVKISTHYSADDIKEAASGFLEEVSSAGKAVTAAVIQANENESAEHILGEADEEGIQIVYAPSGGQVTEAGIDDELGMYVKISHDGKISVCGRMASLAVLTGERVRKGDIIGSFDSSTGTEFYYKNEKVELNSKISA